MLGCVLKQPADQLDYDVDFSRWLATDDYITQATSSVSPGYDAVSNPDGVQINVTQLIGEIVKVWVSGGVDGVVYKVTVVASTAGGRIKEVDFQIRVKDC